MDNVFDKAKQEIKELVELAKYITRFDSEIMKAGRINPTKTAMSKRNKSERRYVYLLKKYT